MAHISLLTRSKEIHLLCLLSHTSHIFAALGCRGFQIVQILFLQGMPCRQYMAKNQGRVITEDILAIVVSGAFAQSHTPLNILGGF